jgi:hypothetical protein
MVIAGSLEGKAKSQNDLTSAGASRDPLDLCGIDYGDATYTDFIQHVDTVFENAERECYVTFVSLTDPIASQLTMTRLLEEYYVLGKDKLPSLKDCNLCCRGELAFYFFGWMTDYTVN